MQVHILYFGVLKDLVGAAEEMLEVGPGPMTVGAVVDGLAARLPGSPVPNPVWSTVAVAVNRVYAVRATVLQDGDEVALLPPVSGGTGDAG